MAVEEGDEPRCEIDRRLVPIAVDETVGFSPRVIAPIHPVASAFPSLRISVAEIVCQHEIYHIGCLGVVGEVATRLANEVDQLILPTLCTIDLGSE